ncbi:SagB/ThcOx family dehydrogenase [Desulfomicrobium sp. ZS1]|uniref:SagB/ThcOx family dehydrogenase n=1 Tax=Desulfomicrobium sp. ZS1 TaxID=2952228 RepID=UPI0020B1B09D|nr:SagB/ThcOx family dehydrogenase [Desulfomicrobium sp. ZS1]UTF51329.1 SagB/ThcOx family dehydrogenase [Desulfomicrobium sp. ZS1]
MSMQTMRAFLKDDLRLQLDFSRSDQNLGIAPPPVQKAVRQGQTVVALPGGAVTSFAGRIDLVQALAARKSHRAWRDESLSLEELGFLLWAVQGVRRRGGPASVFRTVPSAGCRHALETYVLVNNCSSLEQGVYRYLPLDHALVLEAVAGADFTARQHEAVLMQTFVTRAPVVLVWATIPYRMEWRYMEAAHRVIALDAGHACQNLYLAVQAVGCGTCAVAAFHQQVLDELLGVDGEDEFALYLAPVGKV